MKDSIMIKNLDAQSILQIVDMDCSPLPNERDSIYLNFYRFFRDTCWVAVCNSEVVGFVLGFIDQTNAYHGYLNYLFVKNAYRKNGIGSMLIHKFELAAKEKGCNMITLLTSKQENLDYYNKFGYKVNHNLPNWKQDDAVYHYIYNKKKVFLLVKELV